MRAEIIAVGSELLSFSRAETNSLYLATQLIPLGVWIARKTVVGDREKEILEALQAALQESDIVILTGGLGPTNDDITREVVAEFLGRDLKEEKGLIDLLKTRYLKFGLRLTPNNRKQAMVPEGSEVLPNPFGTAPGLLLHENGSLIFLLPGPPRELCPMTEDHVIPLIRKYKNPVGRPTRQLKVASEAESKVDARIESVYKEYPDIETTILSSPGIISLYFVWNGPPSAESEGRLEELVRRVAGKMGASVFTYEEEGLVDVLARLLVTSGKTLAVAESCTGGQIGKLLTDVSGSSRFFLGGVISYSNRSKSELLFVKEELLNQKGAVSESVAKQMAEGVRDQFGSDIGLAVTGVAGPTGGTKDKPVGTVYVGLSADGKTEVRKLFLPGSRESIRLRTSNLALDWVRRKLS